MFKTIQDGPMSGPIPGTGKVTTFSSGGGPSKRTNRRPYIKKTKSEIPWPRSEVPVPGELRRPSRDPPGVPRRGIPQGFLVRIPKHPCVLKEVLRIPEEFTSAPNCSLRLSEMIHNSCGSSLALPRGFSIEVFDLLNFFLL